MASEARVSRPADFLLFLSRCAFLTAAASAVVAVVVVYRIWMLANSKTPDGFPGGWLFGLGEIATRPFRGIDPLRPAKETGFLDFPAIVALDVYLVAMLVFAFLGFVLANAVPAPTEATRPPHVVTRPQGPRRPSQIRSLLAERATKTSRSLARAGAVIRRQDWAGYQAWLRTRLGLASSRTAAGANRVYEIAEAGLRRVTAQPSREKPPRIRGLPASG
jgi:hypothetical protein